MTASQVNVLIVEDEAALADSYAEWLDEEYAVRTAYSGESAVAALDEAVDVVLLDRRLPDLSGEAVLDVIEERELDCRVALVSAVEPDFDVLELGYDLYVEKPVTDAETLRSAVETLCRRDDYDAEMRRYFELASKRGTLEAKKSQSELEGSAAYRAVLDQLDALQVEVESTMSRLDNDDYRADFHDRREAWLTSPDDATTDADAETEAETPEGTSSADTLGPDAGTGTPSPETPGRKRETERE